MAWQDAAAKIVQGFAGAAGNTDAQKQVGQWQGQRADQAKTAQQLQLAPLTQAIAADRQKLTAFIDDKGNVIPEHQKDYDATVKNMGDMIGRMRVMLGQKAPNEEPNHFESTIAGLTDKLHITRDLAHQLKTKQQQKAGQYQAQTQQTAQDTAAGVLPYAMTPEGQQQAGKTAGEMTVEQQKAKDAQALKTQEGEQAIALEREKQKDKPPKAPKVLGSETMPYGMQDEEKGVTYLPSQLGPNGNAPPEYKEMWKSIQDAKVAKQAEEQHKEDERIAMQSRTIAAGFERMGQSQQFQELMAQYRSDLTENRAQKTLADNSEATVNALKSQYAQPGNKAVADNELQNFYTTVVQKGGRKTAAELALTLKIGSWGMNMQQMAKKASSGELPDQLRKDLLSGMEAVAKEQRAEADKNKPELPKLNVPEGPKTKQLKATKGGQSNVIVVSPEDMK